MKSACFVVLCGFALVASGCVASTDDTSDTEVSDEGDSDTGDPGRSPAPEVEPADYTDYYGDIENDDFGGPHRPADEVDPSLPEDGDAATPVEEMGSQAASAGVR